MTRRKSIILLGSTGSIGNSTLDVVARHPERFRVAALAANRNVSLLVKQIRTFKPQVVAVADPEALDVVRGRMRRWARRPRLFCGPEGIRRAAVLPAGNLVVSAIVGTAGLLPTLDAIRAGKDVALANKETLVVAGEAVMAAVRARGVKLLPVDSEHAALSQCLEGQRSRMVKRLILTASGGPFARTPAEELKHVTVEKALKHPTWSMGRKISIDSATMMNKGLEVIEAHHLFGVPYDRIAVVIHPQSIVHSMVEFTDGSLLAQMASPDMRLPIATALADPGRLDGVIRPLDFSHDLSLTFLPPDGKRFPCLGLAYAAGRQGGTAPAIMNAANEAAVAAFLAGRLSFLGIAAVIKRVLARTFPGKPTLETLLQADGWARRAAEEEIACKL